MTYLGHFTAGVKVTLISDYKLYINNPKERQFSLNPLPEV